MNASLLRDRHVDSLRMEFGSPEKPLAKGDDGLDGILDILESEAGDLTPDKVKVTLRRAARYSRAGAYKRLSREEPPARSVWVKRSHLPEVEMGIHFTDIGPNHFTVDTYASPLNFFADEGKAQRVVSFMRALAREYQPLGGFAHGASDYFLSRSQARSQRRGEEFWDLEEIFWLNILGKSLIKKIGRKRALSTPAEHLEELPNGSILFLTRPTPKDFDSEPARAAQAKALVHLRPELSSEAVLARLRARSAVFVPVEPRWDADVAPFFADLLEHSGLNELHPLTVRLNALEIPPISEWLPLEAAPATDVDDPKAAADRYESFYAEGLIAPLYKKVPELMKELPESLPKLDSYLYRLRCSRIARRDTENLFVPSVGAYLGMVMVHHLGGRWVPRKNLDEVQVIVGDRAFLPILRARHLLADEESPLRYSLTQLYRFAARHLAERALTGEHRSRGGSDPSRPPRA